MPVDYNIALRTAYLQAAAASIEEDEDAIKLYRDFYAGEQGVKLTDRQAQYLTNSPESLANISRRVVHIAADRLRIPEDGIRPANEASQVYADTVRGWWADAVESDEGDDIDVCGLQPDLYNASLRDGCVALVVGWDAAQGKPTFTPNLLYDGESGLIRFHYDSDDTLLFASKRWTINNPLNPKETGTRRLNIYTPGYIERYKATSGGWELLQPEELDGLPNPQPWTTTGTMAGEPLGIPIIPFENPNGSELQDVISLQETINHNLATLDIVTDYHGLPLLYVTGQTTMPDSTGAKSVPNFGPGMLIEIADSAGAVGRIEPANLTALFEGGVMSWVQVLALVKGWPLFLFDRAQQPPSGVALQQMERGLIEQVTAKQTVFAGAWRKAFNMGRKLHRLYTGQDLPGQITFVWQPAQSQDDLAYYTALEKKFVAGEIPIIQRWRELGYSLDTINQMLQDRNREDDLGLADTITGIEQ